MHILFCWLSPTPWWQYLFNVSTIIEHWVLLWIGLIFVGATFLVETISPWPPMSWLGNLTQCFIIDIFNWLCSLWSHCSWLYAFEWKTCLVFCLFNLRSVFRPGSYGFGILIPIHIFVVQIHAYFNYSMFTYLYMAAYGSLSSYWHAILLYTCLLCLLCAFMGIQGPC